MKITSSFILSFLFLTNFALSQNKVENAVNAFTEKAGMEHASISIQVINLANGSTVAEHNQDLTLATASTAQIILNSHCLRYSRSKFQS